MQTLQKRVRQSIQFAIGEPDEKGNRQFALTGTLILGKDGCLFASNTSQATIDGKTIVVGETFDVEDPVTGETFGLKVRLNIGDTRKVFKPRNPAPESKSVDVGI